MTTQEIVSRLWNLCNVLRDDGITYHQYVTELTYILFRKMANETGAEGRFAEGIKRLSRSRKTTRSRSFSIILGTLYRRNQGWSSISTTRICCACSAHIAPEE